MSVWSCVFELPRALSDGGIMGDAVLCVCVAVCATACAGLDDGALAVDVAGFVRDGRREPSLPRAARRRRRGCR